MAKVVLLDASALIAVYSSSDQHHQWGLQLFRDTLDADLEMPALSLAEVLVHPTQKGTQAKFLGSIEGLGLRIADLPADCAGELAALRVETGLKMPDVVVLRQAMAIGAMLATTDQKLAKAAAAKGLEVSSPQF